MSTPDSAIIQNVLTGNPALFDTLVSRHLRAVYAVAYAQRPNHADAEDITQEAFLKAYQSLDTLRDATRFEGWITTIARNLAKRPGRHHGKEVSLDDTDLPDASLISKATKEEIHGILRASVDQLDEHSRETLLLHYFAGKSTQEIADLTEISQAAVLKRLQRGRERLGEQLLTQYRDTFAPEDSLDKRKQTITRAIALTTPAWALEPTVAATLSGTLIATAMKLTIAASIAATGFIIASLVLMEKESPLDARVIPAESNTTQTQVPAITELIEDPESVFLAIASPPDTHETVSTNRETDSTPAADTKSYENIDLSVMTSATFEDIHLAQILEIVRENYAEDTLFLIDLDAVGIPYDTDSPNPPTVPDTGLPTYQYRTDGMIEYINVRNVTMLQSLQAVVVPLGLQFVSEPGFIWISTPDLIAQESTWEPESRFKPYENEDRLLEKTNVVFENIHLSDLMEILSDNYDINIVWDYGIIEPPELPEILPISYYPAETTTDGRIPYISMKRIQVRDALKAMLRPLGLSYIIQRNHIWISTPQRIESEIDPPRRFSSQQIFQDRLALEEKLRQPMGIAFEDIYVTDLFDVLTSNYEIGFAIDQNIVTPDGYTDEEYARYYGRPRAIPPCKTCTPVSNGIIRNINLNKLRLGELLDIIALQLDLDYIMGDGQVIFSTPERIRASDIRQKSLISAANFLEHLQ